MITENDLKIITQLRSNSRKKVTDISREVGIPVTTIYDKIRGHERKGIIRKHTTLLDFNKMGFTSNMLLGLNVPRESREALRIYLGEHPNVNSLFRPDYGIDFLAETVFENPARLQEFIDNLEITFRASKTYSFNLAQELKREEFLGGNLYDEGT